ncbi:trypco2 family protein [Streptomyces sp. NPDC056242]|uniref:trypco2 family protein n=1 Tax=Streptomyces sp. NPDC056242 TaxID=3345760 RepID=UPI0035E2017D
MSAPFDEIGLADAISAIRDDILAATRRNASSPLRFELGEIQMEFMVELRRDTRAKGGVKAWVVDASAERGHGATHAQRVAFTLKPKNTVTGQGWDISNDGEGRTGCFGESGVASNE